MNPTGGSNVGWTHPPRREARLVTENPDDRPREDRGEPGAEGGDSDAARKAPPAPAEDDSPLGDTDQHSDADA
jgi:hypothetical protein